MRLAYRAAQVRAAEQTAIAALVDAGGSGSELMQRAAAGVAAAARRLLGGSYGRTVLVLAGSGDNGGDALFAGARLAGRGSAVVVCATSDRGLHPAGQVACLRAGARPVGVETAEELLRHDRVDLVIDGVLGLGARAGLSGPAARLAAVCAETGTPVLAVDLPSGLDPDAGAVSSSFVAERTVTFGGRRLAHLMTPAAARCGTVEVVDLGVDLGEATLRQWEPADVAAALPVPAATDHKYSRGVVGLDTGSADYPGAGVLATLGAVHTGVGMVRHLGSAAQAVVARVPNVVAAPGRVQALVLGSGWGDVPDATDRVRAAVERVGEEGAALLLDADALRPLADGSDLLAGLDADRLLLTPHAGELARLLDVPRTAVEDDPLAAVTTAAERFGATVLLKGGRQYVARPGGVTVDQAVPGPAWTAQAGSGDVLAGICGALLAGGLPADRAGVVGASLQALTAARESGPHPPQHLAAALPATVVALIG